MLTLGQFAVAVGAPKRWVQNAFRVLGIKGGYSVANARALSWARMLKESVGLPLTRGLPLAGHALGRFPGERTWSLPDDDGAVRVTVDLERFLSDFHARLSLARSWYAERRRGRPPKRRRGGVAWAREHGVDLSLLEAQLDRTPAERLRQLDEAAAFLDRARVTG